MRRRELIMLVAGSTLAAPLAAFAQNTSKFYRLGLLVNGAAEGEKSPLRLALARGLAQTDFIEGKI